MSARKQKYITMGFDDEVLSRISTCAGYRLVFTGAYAAVTSICVTRHATMRDPNRIKFCVSSLIALGGFEGDFFFAMLRLDTALIKSNQQAFIKIHSISIGYFFAIQCCI